MQLSNNTSRRTLLKTAFCATLGLSLSISAAGIRAADIESIHFLIPGGAGGGSGRAHV